MTALFECWVLGEENSCLASGLEKAIQRIDLEGQLWLDLSMCCCFLLRQLVLSCLHGADVPR